MRIWLHTLDPSTGDLLGLLDVRPDSAAEALITAGKADPVNAGLQTTPAPGAKYAGNAAIVVVPAPVAPSVTTAPVIAGNTAVGSVLTCTPGTYAGSPTPTVTRKWQAAGVDIPGATGLTYTTQAADVGDAITCVETATNSAGSINGTSNAITVV